MGHVRVVSLFFNSSPKRFDLLTKTMKELLPNANHTHLFDVCRTRWIGRIDGLDVFVEIFRAIVRSLEIIKCNVGGKWNSDSVCDASGLFHQMLSFQFLYALSLHLNVSNSEEHTQSSFSLLCSMLSPRIEMSHFSTLVYVDCKQKLISTMKNGVAWP